MVGFGMHASTSGMPSSDPGPSTSMPPSEEILSAFEEVLKKMELPPDKVRTLRNCDLKKKWDLVCNQRMFKTQTVADPSVYLEKLSACLDTKAHKKKKKLPGGESEVLSHLEISLRTNSIDWVHSFLSPEHDGFRILVDYLSLLQGSYSEFYMPDNSNNSYGNATASPLHASQPTFLYTNSFDGQHYSSATSTISSSNGGGISFDDGYSSMKTPMNTSIFRTKPASSAAKASKQLKQINELEDDVHLCISCLRALMNNKAGWNIVFDSPQAIYCIVRSILHHSLRTKALAIDLLSAICMVKDGHERIVNAFDRFRMEYKERYRFQTLFHFFHSPSEFNVDFLASCMKYINVVVHSTEDLNQRVALQYEFTNLGLDRFLEQQHGFQDYDAISIHVNRYRSNSIDVDRLLSESNHRLELLDYTAKLERDNSLQRERLQEVEADYIARQAMLSKRLSDLMAEKDTLEREKNNKDLTIHTLTRDFKDREQKYERERSQLESRIQELEKTKKEIQEGLKIAQKASAKAAASAVALQNSPVPSPSTPTAPAVNGKPVMTTTSVPPAPPPPPSGITAKSSAAPPPPPPPPQLSKMAPVHKTGGIPPPPPNLNMLRNPIIEAPTKIKKIAPTKHKLPMFNWSALNPNQVKGTVFNEINDENLADALNLTFLEEMFRVGNADSANELTSSTANDQPSPGSSASSVTTSTTGVHKESSNKSTLLGTKRLQNIAITRRKLAKPVGEIMSAVHRFDLSSLPQDHVDILLPIVPTPDEVQQYRDYAAKNDSTFDGLTLEDQFIASLMNIERLSQKLNIMAFMAGFSETVNLLVPQIQKVTAASKSIKEATSFHKAIEVILAVGNAMNGTRRVPVDGFKLSSLDSLMILKSSRDRSITLMHVIAEIIYNDFSNLLDTLSEQLKFAESAAGVSMESIGTDVRDIEAKFKNAVTEENRKGEDAPAALKQFLEDAKPQIALLRDNYKLAQEAFAECAEFYGEMSAARSQPDSAAFFTRISTFVKHFEQALADNETRRAMEQRQLAEQERKAAQIERNATNLDKNKAQNRMVDELNARFLRSMGADPKRKMDSRDIGDGDFERIMNGLKDGYVALDAPAPVPVKRRGIGKSPSPNRRPKSITKEVQRDRA